MHVPSSGLAVAAASAILWSTAAAADAPNVVASIKPLHSLVAGVMGDVGTPHLIVAGGDEPHTYALRPSDAEALSKADVVFWIGENFETFLRAPLANLGAGRLNVEMVETPGLTLYEYGSDADDGHHEEGHGVHADDDDDHDHAHADAGGHDHDHDHDHDHAAEGHDGEDDDHEGHAHAGDENGHGHAHADAEDAHDHAHEHTGLDGHIWLDPDNARIMVAAIADALADADPGNAATYRGNAEALSRRLEALESDIASRLEPYRSVPYYTFHEAFRYFDRRFGLNGRGAIAVSPELQPGAQRIAEIRAAIGSDERVCVFAEPAFPPRLVDVIVEGTNARSGVLDDLGQALTPGPELYFEVMTANADAFARCFQSTM